MKPINQNLYQFTSYIPPMDFTIHQYLLASEPAILFATGTAAQAQQILPQIKEILNGKELTYLFISHLESDECGGLSLFQAAYPNLQVLCSPLAARELPGFGYTGKLTVGTPDTLLTDGALTLQFFEYPSEVHLQKGLVCYEKNSGIFYSSDLLLRYGNAGGKTISSDWQQEISALHLDSLPGVDCFAELKQNLQQITPAFVAVGHGFCIECTEGA